MAQEIMAQMTKYVKTTHFQN